MTTIQTLKLYAFCLVAFWSAAAYLILGIK